MPYCDCGVFLINCYLFPIDSFLLNTSHIFILHDFLPFRHMDLLRHPIMGDPDYWFQDGGRLSAFSTATRSVLSAANTDANADSLSQPLSLSPTQFPPRLVGRGIFLWSVGISFNHPVTGARMDMVLEEPESYAKLRADLLGYE